MATKDNLLQSKAQELAPSDNQYKNISLNQCHQSPSLNVTQINSTPTSNDEKFSEDTSVETKAKDTNIHAWNKNESIQLKPSDFSNNNEAEKFNKKTESSSCDSTLSLHCRNYENFGGILSDEKINDKKDVRETNNTASQYFGLSGSSVFDIPQQQESEYYEPEIVPFKSSQIILNVNEPQSEYKKLIENANELYKAKRFTEAAKAYSDIISYTRLTSTERAIVYYNRSTTYLKLISLKHSLRQARKDAETSLKLEPNWWKGYYRLATVLMETEKWAESKDMLLKALALDPTNATIKEAIITVENGIWEDSLNYQQRRRLHELLNFMKYRDVKPSYESDTSSDEGQEDEAEEVKRSSEPDYDDFDFQYQSNNNESLISDIANNSSDNLNTHEEIILDSSTDSVEALLTSKTEKSLTSKDLLLISLGTDDSFKCNEVPFPPLDIPHLKGNYLFIVNAEKIANIGDVVSTDRLSPWNNEQKKIRSKQYYIDFIVEDNSVKKYTRSEAKTRDPFKNYCFEYQSHHHEHAVTKKIIAICQPHDKKPVEASRICFYYEVQEDSENIRKLQGKIMTPRICPSTSGKVKQLLSQKNTPSQALHKYQENSSLMENVNAVTQAQVNDLARHMKDRSPPTNRGQKKQINFDEILKFVDDQKFVMEFSKSGDDIKIFCGVKAAFSMMEASLITATAANELSKEVESALKLAPHLRYSKLQEIVNSEKYQKLQLTSCFYLDTTFNVSDLYLTILLFSSPFLTRKDGTPVCIVGGIMLSSKKDLSSYEWMGFQLNKYVPSHGRFGRSVATDADLALDGILKALFFSPPCVRLHCGEHLMGNVETYIDDPTTKQRILKDIFGSVTEGIRMKGLFDELSFPEFDLKLNYLCSLDYWKLNPRLIEWLSQPARRERLYKRYGLVNRILGGWGFNMSNTNIIENCNMNIKSLIPDNTPVQILIRKLEEFVNGQIISAGMAFIQMEPVQLRDPTKFIGTEAWKRLSTEKRKTLLKTIGLDFTDTITGFQLVPNTFPAELAPNLSPEQRFSMVEKAKALEVFTSSTKGSYIVNDSKPAKVFIDGKLISCNCKYEERRAQICVHLLAVHFKYTELHIIETILIKRQNETMSERHTAAITTTSGTKPGTSRRRAPASTRNSKRPKITGVIDLEPVHYNAQNLAAIGTPSLPSVTPISHYNRQRQNESRPIAVARHANTYHPPSACALRNFKLAYNLNLDELWWNSNAFYLKEFKNIRDMYKRNCAHCNMAFKRNQDLFVFTHLEQYEFKMLTTNEVKMGYGERLICPTFNCFGNRFPYATKDCIISVVDADTYAHVMQRIFPD